jgi:hypothetical protein
MIWRILAVICAALIIAATAAYAQGWNSSNGSGIVRVDSWRTTTPYDRPAIFFLRRPEAFLPTSYTVVSPNTESITISGPGYLVREFRVKGSQSDPLSASVTRRHYLSLAGKPRRRG